MADNEALTHLNAEGEVHMVSVGEKAITARRAVAVGRVKMSHETVAKVRSGTASKGDVDATARIAGIMAAKRTPELIPLCHAVALTGVSVELAWRDDGAEITATANAIDRTGVEMEAMVAVSIAALSIYDMVKGIDRGAVIERIELTEKSGGRSGHWVR